MKPLRNDSERSVRARTDVLDGYRGIAIALVLAYHTWLFSWFTPYPKIFDLAIPVDAFLRTGYLGVELFFAISAFVLFLPWARRAVAGERAAPQTTRSYIYRRFIKIVPSYYLALAITFVAAASERFEVPIGQSLATHVPFLTNWSSGGLGRANSVFWSLGTEVQFYCIFPFLARAFVRRPSLVAAIMFAIAAAYRYDLSTCCLAVETYNRQIPAFLDIFAAGMLAAYGVAVVERRFAERAGVPALATALAIASVAGGIALIFWSNAVAYDTNGREHWTVFNRALVAIAAGGALFASCFAGGFVRAIVANPLTRFLSTISYNLYLWHTLVLIWLLHARIVPYKTLVPHDDDAWKLPYIALGWTLAIGISAAITYFIERPLLGTVKPQTFSFDWSRIIPRPPAATSERRT